MRNALTMAGVDQSQIGYVNAHAMVSVQVLREGLLPPTINLTGPEDIADKFDLAPNVAKAKSVDYALSNSLDFGGVNATLVFGRIQAITAYLGGKVLTKARAMAIP